MRKRPNDPRDRPGWRRQRSLRIAMARQSSTPVICWRCEQPITDLSADAVDLGHIIDVATAAPGAPQRVALEHRRCNRSARMALGREMIRKTRYKGTKWEPSELKRATP